MLPLVLVMLCSILTGTVFAQTTARIQIIHNAPDLAVDPVDVIVDGVVAVNDLGFREATPFLDIDLTSTIELDFGVGPIPAPIPAGLTPGGSFVIMATGVLPTSTGYDASVETANGGDIDFTTILLDAGADTTTTAGFVNVAVAHGATDADTVDVLANGGPLIDDLAYEDFTGYATVPTAEYILQVTPYNNNSTVVASYVADLAGLNLDGEGIVVFASGFLNPANNNNGPAFGLFATTRAGGPAVPLPTVGTARAQIIHNSADPAAATVDIYVDIVTDTVKFDDVAFREATPFVDLPTGYGLTAVVAGSGSADITDQVVGSFPLTAVDGESYTIVASGVVGTGFAANPDAVNTDFTLLVRPGARESAANAGEVDLLVHHGSTDAPSVGINANGGAVVPAATYQDFAGYLSVPATEFRVDVTAVNDPSTIIAPFYVDLSGFADEALTVFASGFLDPAANNSGPAFGLYAVSAAGGPAIPLTAVGAARAQIIHNSAAPAADTVDIYVNTLADTVKLDDVAFRNATGFLDLPSDYPLDIVIAGSNSANIGDAVVATIPATVMDGESYSIVASGVLGGTFAANPDGINTDFTLLVNPGARETAANPGEVDLLVHHGSTDAPSVGIAANGGLIVDSAAYQDFAGYLGVPAAAYRVDVTAPNDADNIIAPFYVDLSGFPDEALTVFASGFLTPADNDDGPAFGLFAVSAAGGEAIPLSPVGEARVQVIHNSADPAAATVDIYVDILRDTLKFDDVSFRAATAFQSLPTGYDLDIVVAGPSSADITDAAVDTTTATLMAGDTLYAVANGVLDTTGFSTAANGDAIFFDLYFGAAREAAVDPTKFDLKVFHGATDAPVVDVAVNEGIPALIDSLPYGVFTDYVAVDPALYELGVGAHELTDAADILASFDADLSGAAGGAGLILASGFLDVTDEPTGALSFGLLFVQPDGTATLLPVTTGLDLPLDNSVVRVYPNPIRGQATLDYQVQQGGAVNVQLFDLQGRELMSESVERVPGNYQMNLNTEGFTSGVHLLMVTTPTTRSVMRVTIQE